MTIACQPSLRSYQASERFVPAKGKDLLPELGKKVSKMSNYTMELVQVQAECQKMYRRPQPDKKVYRRDDRVPNRVHR